MAVSFALYGVLKKGEGGGAPGPDGGVRRPLLPALGYVPPGRFVQSPPDALFLVLAGPGSGPVPAVPLWLFAKAAPKIPMGVLDMLHYIAPTVTLLKSVVRFHQPVPMAYWFGLG